MCLDFSVRKGSVSLLPFSYRHGLALALFGKQAQVRSDLVKSLHESRELRSCAFSNLPADDGSLSFDAIGLMISNPDEESHEVSAESFPSSKESCRHGRDFFAASARVRSESTPGKEADLRTLSSAGLGLVCDEGGQKRKRVSFGKQVRDQMKWMTTRRHRCRPPAPLASWTGAE